MTNCPPPSREGCSQPVPWTEQAATTGVIDSVEGMSKRMAPAAATARIDPAATTSARARIRRLEERALGGDGCKRQSEQSDNPVELCRLGD